MKREVEDYDYMNHMEILFQIVDFLSEEKLISPDERMRFLTLLRGDKFSCRQQ